MELVAGAHELRDRFELQQGQFFATYQYKNLWWELDGKIFGYGDLTSQDVFRIQSKLTETEVFQGWNEHHGTSFQQRSAPMIRIIHNDILMAGDPELLEDYDL